MQGLAAHGVPRRWQIMAGQYTGIGALLLISVLAALGLSSASDSASRRLVTGSLSTAIDASIWSRWALNSPAAAPS